MRRFVTIKQCLPPREGDGKNGHWVRTPLVVAWKEKDSNAQEYEQSIVVEVPSYVNEPLVDTYIKQAKEIELSYYAEANEYNGRWYNNFRAYLPKDLMTNQLTPRAF